MPVFSKQYRDKVGGAQLRRVPHSLSLTHSLTHTLPLFHSVIAISAERRLFIPSHAECRGTAHF